MNRDIAIIGLDLNFPSARNLNEFWEILKNNKQVQEFIDDGVKLDINNRNTFDYNFFNLTKKESDGIEIQQKKFLESCWRVLENSGYIKNKSKNKIGIFGSCGFNSELIKKYQNLPETNFLDSNKNIQLMINNDKDYLTTRVAHKLNLNGPSMTIQTACSSSLVAVHQAINSILLDDCKLAIAGGVSILTPSICKTELNEDLVISKTGECKPFDIDANGTIFGSGCGSILLKKLEDAEKDGDYIHAVIKGSSINNDGSEKMSFTAPSIIGQEKVIKEALDKSNLKFSDLTYIETHGTATKIGDVIEISAIKKLSKDLDSICSIGSLKGNIGHLSWASGIAGLIKIILMMKYKKLVPSGNFKNENPILGLKDSNIQVSNSIKDIKSEKFNFGISSFGFGGTNCHMVLQNYNNQINKSEKEINQLFKLSVDNEKYIKPYIEDIKDHIIDFSDDDLNIFSKNMNLHKEDFKIKKSFIFKNKIDFLEKLEKLNNIENNKKDEIIFTFPGQGSQISLMGLELYNKFPIYKKYIDYIHNFLHNNFNFNLKKKLFEEIRENESTYITHLTLFASEVAYSKLLIELGIKPSKVLGHSLGEYASAYISGIFSLDDTINLVEKRGKLLNSLSDDGGMMIVFSSFEIIKDMLNDKIDIAIINSENQLLLSGKRKYLEEIEESLSSKNIKFKYSTNKKAFHSREVIKIKNEFKNYIKNFKLNFPTITYLSPKLKNKFEPFQIEYWVEQIEDSVDFFKISKEISNSILIECGPKNVLTKLSKINSTCNLNSYFAGFNSDFDEILDIINYFYNNNFNINWDNLYNKINKVPLLPFPFYNVEKKYHFLELDYIEENFKKLDKYDKELLNLNYFIIDKLIILFKEIDLLPNLNEEVNIDILIKKIPIKHKKFILNIFNHLENYGIVELKNNNLFFKKELNLNLSAPNTNSVEFKLVNSILSNLNKIIFNQIKGTEILFDTDNKNLVDDLYKQNSILNILNYNLFDIIKSEASKNKIRILEIGSGTGSTTEKLIPLIKTHNIDYTFTDVSNNFFNKFKLKYPDLDINYKIFNLDSDNSIKFNKNEYDFIIANNALHISKNLTFSINNLNKLLCPDGKLILIEGTKSHLWVDIIFGSLEGWWNFDDFRNKKNHILLSFEEWKSILNKNFKKVVSLNNNSCNNFKQELIIASKKDFNSNNYFLNLSNENLEIPLYKIIEINELGSLEGINELLIYYNQDDINFSYDLVKLLKLIKPNFCHKINIISKNGIFHNNLKSFNPNNSLIKGIINTMRLEYKKININYIDIDFFNFNLIDEIFSGSNNSDYLIREKKVFSFKLKNKLISNNNNNNLIKNKRILLLGGNGGIGLELCKKLAKNNQLIIFSRSGISNNNKVELKKLGLINNIEEIIGNISEKSDVENIFKKFKEINKIYFLIGGINDKLILNQDSKSYNNVINNKIFGLKNLVGSINKFNLKIDSLIIFSSIVSILGNVGQVNHSAANSFLNEYGKYLNKISNYDVKVIPWGAWKGVGTINCKILEKKVLNSGFNLFNFNEGYEILNIIENSENYFEIYSPMNWKLFLNKFELDRTPNFLSNFYEKSELEENKYGDNISLNEIVKEVLGEEINENENLFSFGLDSLSVIELKTLIEEKLNKKISSNEIYELKTISEIKNKIDLNSNIEINKNEILISENKNKFSIQQKRWKKLSEVGYGKLLIPVYLEEIDLNKFELSLIKLIESFPILQRTFGNKGKIIKFNGFNEKNFIDLSNNSEYEIKKSLNNIKFNFWNQKFNLDKDLPWKFKLIKIKEKYIFLLFIRHFVFDGISVSLFFNHLMKIYENNNVDLDTNISYSNYISWQNENSTSIPNNVKIWYDNFNETTVLKNNIDKNFSTGDISKNYSFKIKDNLFKELKEYVIKNNISLFSILIFCYAKTLSKILNKNKFIVGSIFNGRTESKFQNVIGPFVYPVPIPVNLEDEQELNNILNKVNFFNENYISSDEFRNLDIFSNFPEETYFTDTFLMLNNYKKENSNSNLKLKVVESLSPIENEFLNSFNIDELREMCGLFLICDFQENTLRLNFWYHYKRFSLNEIKNWSKLFINELEELIGFK